MRSLLTPVMFLLITLVLGGCATSSSIGSIAGGECRIVHTPEFAVRGRTAYDQGWVNKTTEALVDGCRQSRPQARPASLDAPARKAATVKPKAMSPAAKKKSRLRQYLGV